MAENLKGKSRNWGAAVEFLLLLIPSRQGQSWTTLLWQPVYHAKGSQEGNRAGSPQGNVGPIGPGKSRHRGMRMAFGYRYTLGRQDNGWWLVRFPGVPEALTEGETEAEARANACDCIIAALEGYMKAGRPLPRAGARYSGPRRAVLPSLVTAKLAVYETMRAHGWS